MTQKSKGRTRTQGGRSCYDPYTQDLRKMVLEPGSFATYRTAAAIYRAPRAKGISLTTIDTLIAAIALEHRAAVLTLDQDFSRIALITRLALYPF